MPLHTTGTLALHSSLQTAHFPGFVIALRSINDDDEDRELEFVVGCSSDFGLESKIRGCSFEFENKTKVPDSFSAGDTGTGFGVSMRFSTRQDSFQLVFTINAGSVSPYTDVFRITHGSEDEQSVIILFKNATPTGIDYEIEFRPMGTVS